MKYLFAIIFSIGLFTGGQAQKQDFTKSADNDPVATEILERLSKKYEAYKSIEANFTLEIEVPEEDKQIQKGKLIQQGKKFNVDLNDYNMISDGVSLWVHTKRNKEVQWSDYDEDDFEGEMSPKDFYNFYKKDKYVYALVNESFENGKAVQQIEFKPLNEDSEYSKIRLTIEKKTNSILRIKVFSKDQSRFTLSIDNFTPNKKFGDTSFKFDASKYPDIHVEDLRY